MSIYDYSVKRIGGDELSLNEYKGKVMLIVNTATGCGFAPQFDGLEDLYKKYKEQGFEVLGFPCNQFGNQEPGTDMEIKEACALSYDTSYEQFSKIDVNGENAIPLYTYLKGQKGFEGIPGVKGKMLEGIVKKNDKDYKNNSDIKWNFTKFLIDRDGNVVERFESTVEPKEIDKYISKLI
ncbi:MAG: glutathione peroxidase [Suipraeoptans sp.]